MEGLYLYAKKMVELKYPNGHEYKEMFIVGLYGLLCKYKKYHKIIWMIFMQMENYIEDKSLNEIIDENNLELEQNNEDDDAVSSSIHTFITDEHNDLCHILEKPVAVCSKTNLNKKYIILFLNSWVHEMGHLIKSTLNGYKIKGHDFNKSEGQLRSGLSIHTYVFDKDTFDCSTSSKYALLDEAINVIQTTEAIDYAYSLDGMVPDDDVDKFLSELIQYENNDYGYNLITQEVRKLWSIDEFKKLIEDNIVQGNIKEIENSFNNTMDDDKAFAKLDLLLDHIYYADKNMDCLMEYSQNIQKFDEMVSTYKSKLAQLKQ